MKTIVLTGGGTAGHVIPNLALIPLLEKDGWSIHYIGSVSGPERELIAREAPGVTYHPIASGKLRRYLDLKNLSDPFRVIKGAFQSRKILRDLKPSVLFSKGGFVSVPVVWAAKNLSIPTVIHESDITPGLANKLAIPMCKTLCTTFPEAAKAAGAKGVCTGSPIRPQLMSGNREKGLAFASLKGEKPVVLIMGGSSGAQAINHAVAEALDVLLTHYEIIHIRGKGGLNPALERKGYAQFEYVSDELPNLMAAADLVLSRAGANAIWEFAALEKPMLLIPLPLSASRGDQILNAQSFAKKGYAAVLEQEKMNTQSLLDGLNALWEKRDDYRSAMHKDDVSGGLGRLLQAIYNAAK